jgi:Uri superfamily endonuclease
MKGSLFQITTFIKSTETREEKVEKQLQSEKATHNHVDYLIAALYKSPERISSDGGGKQH